MLLLHCLLLGVQFWLATGAVGTTLSARNNTSGFVSVQQGSFMLNGGPFRFYGTNAYWLPMGTDEDMDMTIHDIATAGFKVVRTWAFNDVAHKPSSGTYFQILKDGHASINDGADGLQRLDRLVSAANKYGIKLLLTLTNNWNPVRDQPDDSFSRRNNGGSLPRGYLSNDYGGMDLYIRNFHPNSPTHDLFYTDPAVIGAFKDYLAHIIPRYCKNPAVLGWELGNDLRCSSTLPASPSCNTGTISNWVAQISNYIKSLDSQHLITAGDGGFYCLSCPKSFTKQSIKPNSLLTGPSFDGSYGVDTEDIIAIPSIDFGSFQLFPDQTQYFTTVGTSAASTAIGQGGAWITIHSNTARLLGKPEALTAVAIVTKDHAASFVPFNESARRPDSCGGVETFQQDYAFISWAGLALNGKVEGVLEYLWLQEGLTSHGTTSPLKRDLGPSPQDGAAHHSTPYTNQTVNQVRDSLPVDDLQ